MRQAGQADVQDLERLTKELILKLETLADAKGEYAVSLSVDDPRRNSFLRGAKEAKEEANELRPEVQLARLLDHTELGEVNRFAYDLMKGQFTTFRIVSDLRRLDFASAQCRKKPEETLRSLRSAAEECRKNGQSSVLAVQAITHAMEMLAARIND